MIPRVALVSCAKSDREISSDLEKTLEYSQRYAGRAEIISELRLDFYQGNLNMERILSQQPSIPKIVTLRHSSESGPYPGFQGEERKRISYYKKALQLGAAYIDIEASAGNQALSELDISRRNNNSLDKQQIIVSYHLFSNTPKNIIPLFESIERLEIPDVIAKVATYARHPSDADNMLQAINEYSVIPHIGICMGTEGIRSRIDGPFNGSYLTYAALNERSAPGQPSVNELMHIWSERNILSS